MDRKWSSGIREPAYNLEAPRQTVSLTINADLFARVRSAGINASRIAEQALAAELENRRRMEIEEEVRRSMATIAAYEAEHGSFPEHLQKAYGRWPDLPE